MKTTLLLSLLLASTAFAGFEKWTNKDGKAADLDLIRVVDKDGGKAGEFKMRSGKTITLKTSDLSAGSAAKLEAWKAPEAAASAAAADNDSGSAPTTDKEAAKEGEASAEASPFDRILKGNLVKLQGKSLKKFELTGQPKKYYVFYYTASWCGPCQAFTPDLVKFYEENKNGNFELVLISSDQTEDDMEEYAVSKKMPWPQLKLRKAQDFKKKFDHGVTGIPSLIVCDTKGESLGNYRSKLAELADMVK